MDVSEGPWLWTPHGPERNPDHDNPLTRPCPTCHAATGQRCHSKRRGQPERLDYHDARHQTDEETTDA